MNASNLTGKLGIYQEQSTLPEGLELGQVKEFSDGRKFRLCKNGAVALAAGKLVVAPDLVTNHLGLTPTAAVSVGANEVTVTLGATLATANQYHDGFLMVRSAGHSYKIKSHPAADASGTLKLTLYDDVQAAIAADATIDLVVNPYSGLLVSVNDQANVPRGVPLIAVTASYYFWAQTKGPCATLTDGTPAQGSHVTIGATTAGAVGVPDADTEQIVGKMIKVGVNLKYNPVDLALD